MKPGMSKSLGLIRQQFHPPTLRLGEAERKLDKNLLILLVQVLPVLLW